MPIPSWINPTDVKQNKTDLPIIPGQWTEPAFYLQGYNAKYRFSGALIVEVLDIENYGDEISQALSSVGKQWFVWSYWHTRNPSWFVMTADMVVDGATETAGGKSLTRPAQFFARILAVPTASALKKYGPTGLFLDKT